MDDRHSHDKAQPPAARRSYGAPLLRVHGRMQALTASGTRNKPENRGHPDRVGRL